MDYPETQTTTGTRHRTNRNKTKAQHRKLEGQSRIDNPETQTTTDTRHRTNRNKTKTQHRTLKVQSRMNDPAEDTERRKTKLRHNTEH